MTSDLCSCRCQALLPISQCTVLKRRRWMRVRAVTGSFATHSRADCHSNEATKDCAHIRDLRCLRGLARHGGCHKLEEGKRPPTPKTRSQHLDFTKDPRPLYYKTPPCAFYHKNVCSKAVFRSLVRTKMALSKTGRFLSKAEILGVGAFFPFQNKGGFGRCSLDPQNRNDGTKAGMRVGISATIYRTQNPETPKSLKKVSREEFGTPDPGPPQKVPQQVRKVKKIVKIN